MKKEITAIALVVCLVAVAIVGGSLAYFTDEEEATNTFTVGNVDITLTEPNWDAALKEDAKAATLIPSRVIAKDPTITVAEDSQRAYTFMKVQLSKDFMELLQTYYGENYDFATNYAKVVGDWIVLPEGYAPKVMSADLSAGYVILGVLSPKDPGQSVVYFEGVKIPADVKGEMIDPEGEYEIYITAYAIQAEGFEGKNANAQADRQAAFNALFPPTT